MELMTFEKGTPEEEAYIAAMLYCFEVKLRTWPPYRHGLDSTLQNSLSIRSRSDRHISDVLELVRNFATNPDEVRASHEVTAKARREGDEGIKRRLERVERDQAALLDLFG